jgi:hypothetical protein
MICLFSDAAARPRTMPILSDNSLIDTMRRSFPYPCTEDEDQMFWTAIRGIRGLWVLRAEVHRMRHNLGPVNQVDDRALRYRAYCLSFCILLSILEFPWQKIAPGWPHFFGRFAAQLTWEVYAYIELIAEEAGIEVAKLLWEPNYGGKRVPTS